jgi:hypothetical protein
MEIDLSYGGKLHETLNDRERYVSAIWPYHETNRIMGNTRFVM